MAARRLRALGHNALGLTMIHAVIRAPLSYNVMGARVQLQYGTEAHAFLLRSVHLIHAWRGPNLTARRLRALGHHALRLTMTGAVSNVPEDNHVVHALSQPLCGVGRMKGVSWLKRNVVVMMVTFGCSWGKKM